ncbi:MAG: elongation factor G [Thermomicrobiales bacterium]|nr:elongation factor G [Thermomicrobiales bacterium]
MKQYPADRIRNVGLFGHGSAGKTSLAEALLFDTKAITRHGRIEDGNTTCDYDPDEIRRRVSVSLAVAPLEWRDTKINVLDCPGYADFRGEVVSAMRVVDGAIIVVDASSGVEVGTEHVWQLAEANNLPRMVFVNRMDRENADFSDALASLRETFGKAIAPVQFPIGHDKDFKGIVDLLTEKAYSFHDNHDGGFETGPIPDDLMDQVHFFRQQLVESIAETDEELMMRYLEDDAISTDELIVALEHCVERGEVVPVLCGAATANRGMQPLLDGIVDFFPDSTFKKFERADGEAIEVKEDGPLTAFVFKTLADPHVGRVSYFRVISGTAQTNSPTTNVTQGRSGRLGQLFYMRGKEHLNTDAVGAGDIGAVNKLGNTVTGDTLSDDPQSSPLASIAFPEPSYRAIVTPKTKADLDKLGQALSRIIEEDPSLHLERDPVTSDAVLAGLGEPHIATALERMTRRYNVNVDFGLPNIAYRETIGGKTTAEYKHKKQSGGAGQYGHVFLELSPLPDADFAFTERVVGGSVPRGFFPAVEKGVHDAMEAGPIAGFPVVNISATLTDGSYHDVDSNEMSFRIAAKEAFKKGVLQANPVLLEPVLSLRVIVPDAYTGDIMSDLNGKRAQVSGMQPAGDGMTEIDALAPEAELLKYATDLRSITQGRGNFTAEFSHYQPAPHQVVEQVKARNAEAHAAAS